MVGMQSGEYTLSLRLKENGNGLINIHNVTHTHTLSLCTSMSDVVPSFHR